MAFVAAMNFRHGKPEICASIPAQMVKGLAVLKDSPNEKGVTPERVDPDDFIRFTYARALAHRQPLYAAMARNWGLKVPAEAFAGVVDEAGFLEVVAEALAERMRGA